MTSAPCSLNAVTLTEALHLVRGTPKSQPLHADNEVVSTLRFCGDCGSALWTEWPPKPELRIIKAGIIDGDEVWKGESKLKPVVEHSTKRRPGWMCAFEHAIQFEGQQSPGEAEGELKKVIVG